MKITLIKDCRIYQITIFFQGKPWHPFSPKIRDSQSKTEDSNQKNLINKPVDKNEALLNLFSTPRYRISLPKNKAQPSAGFRHKILNISSHIINDTEADFIFGIITDINNQIIRRKPPTREWFKMNFLQIPCHTNQTFIHYLRQVLLRLEISLQYGQYSYSHGAKINSFFNSATLQE